MIGEMFSILQGVDCPEGVRFADESDIPHMVELGRMFFDSTILPFVTEYDDESMAATMKTLIDGVTGTILVLEKDGEIVGGIGGYTTPAYFNKNATFGQQVFWFVHPDYRSRRSLLLLDTFGAWCKNMGATMIWSGAKQNESYSGMKKVLNRKGYQELETVFVKGV